MRLAPRSVAADVTGGSTELSILAAKISKLRDLQIAVDVYAAAPSLMVLDLLAHQGKDWA